VKRHVFILMVAFCLFMRAGAEETNDIFAQGLALSQAGQFPAAAAAFEKAAQARPAVGTLVDAGLAEWERGRAGAAILAWEQACWINPYDARVLNNLKFAREVAQTDAPDLTWYEAASSWLPANAWLWLAGASLWLTTVMLTLPSVFRWRKAGWHQGLAAVGCGIFLFSLAASYGVVSRTDIGFVLKKNAPLQLTPTKESEVISTLTAGEPARRLRTRGGYYLIRTGFGAGWIARDQFGLINPD
jgi:tetratricopeptide (TPR) repeat protein